LSARANAPLILIGRLKPGLKEREADTQLAVGASRMEKAYPAENKNQTFVVHPLSRLGVSPNPARDDPRPFGALTILLMSMPAVVLLIASPNLANMMLARGAARSKEIAIRLAIGGGRGRIVLQLCTEGFLLAILGGAVGLLVASWGNGLLIRSLVPVIPFDLVFPSRPDVRVLAGEVPRSVVELLQLSRGQVEFFAAIQRRLLKQLREHPELSQRVMRLQTIPGVGEILALSWALEVGEADRLPSIAQAVSYCGLTSAQHNSAGKEQRGPISKQRNKHLQTILIEAAKLAPRRNSQLAAVHERELQRGNCNRATLAVARKLVAYLMAVDKSGKPFEMRAIREEAA
jgi:hypothetical protein